MSELKPGWRRVKFGEVVRQVKDRVDPETSGLERFIAGEHMDTDDLRLRRWGDIGNGYLGPAFHMRFRPGHVLYGSRRTYLRKIAVADFEGICANTTFVLESADSSVLLPKLLPFIMSTDAFHEHSQRESKGSVNPYVNFSDLAWYEFALPPLEEQRQIAHALQSVEALHHAQVEVANRARAIQSSVIMALFKHAKEWPEVAIREAGELRIGRQKSPRFTTGRCPHPYVRVGNLSAWRLDLTSLQSMDFDETELVRYRLIPGDILITEGDLVNKMNVGRSALFPGGVENCCFQNHLIRLRCNPGVEPVYAQLALRWMHMNGVFARAAKVTTIVSLGLTRLSTLPFPLAPRHLQREMSDAWSMVRDLDLALASRVDSVSHLKRHVLTRGLG